MCGIFGYVGRRSAFPLVFDGLRRLEYRGYDSAGIAVIDDGQLHVMRAVGPVLNLTTSAPPTGGIAIGHTRWATHGEPSERNAHPHVDCTGTLAVVHNGIIENHAELRHRLEEHGHRFRSDTDTEVIAHLLEEQGGAPAVGVAKAMGELRGDFAFAVVSQATPDTIVVARRGGPPILIGVGDGEHFVSSDLLALTPHTSRVVTLEDGELAVVGAHAIEYAGVTGVTPAERAPVTVAWRAEDAERNGHATFMHKEIHEQPRAILKTLTNRVSTDVGDITLEGVRLTDEQWRTVDRAILIACGTSFHAGLIGAMYLERLAGIPAHAETASEFRYREPVIGPHDLCIFISQSGETADTLGAMRFVKGRGAPTIGICNVPGTSLTREVDGTIMTMTGPEVGVASTKAFTAQVVALLLLAIRASRGRRSLGRDTTRGLLRALATLPDRIDEALTDEEQVRALAELSQDRRDFFYLGRGLGYPVALEGALKLKEIAYVRAEAFPGGEMKHGPLALIHPRTTTLALALPGATHAKMVSTIQEVRARGGSIVAVCDRADTLVASLADHTLALPPCHEYLAPCVAVLPFQLFAHHVAVLRGCDVDRPRNLAKSVTVE